MDFESYLDALASAEPTPGGGSAATLVGALGAALCAMVARITLGNPKYAGVHAEAAAIVADADATRRSLLEVRPLDEAAFRAVIDAQALPRATEEQKTERTLRVQAALVRAAEVPLEAARLAAQTLEIAARTARLGNEHLNSDVECALSFGRAALAASAANVAVNHHYIKDADVIARQQKELERITALASG